jgi:hypothetical protein|tara:strand:- start:22 stop:420 length:399 start_codon:yes stop_codon:yes gene_type:complete
MTWLEKNYDSCNIGLSGESEVREWFKNKKIPFMQVDIMFKYDGKWCLGEIKTQEKFLAPPFDGHGLPKWQIDRRIQFYNDTNIEPFLIVKDLKENCLYIESLLILMKGEKFQTKGKSPRVIFKLSNFKKIKL